LLQACYGKCTTPLPIPFSAPPLLTSP
jgi:hypothetical protein